MIWTKLKKAFEERLHDDLKGNLEFHMARYRKSHDAFGESMHVVWNKEKVAMMNYMGHFSERENEDPVVLENKGMHNSSDFRENMWKSLQMTVTEMLESDNYMYRAIGLMDKRCGKRTLERYDIENEPYQFVKDIYAIRKNKQLERK